MSDSLGVWRSANGMSYQDAKTRIQKNQANGTNGADGAYNQSAYLSELNKKVDANVIAGAWDGKTPFGSGNRYTVMIHPDFLQMMHSDPELETYYDAQINVLAKEGAEFKEREEAKGTIIHSQGSYINENGEISAYCHFTMQSGGSGNATSDKKTKSAKELAEEMRKKLEEEEKEKLLEKKQEDKKALLNSLNALVNVSVTQSESNT